MKRKASEKEDSDRPDRQFRSDDLAAFAFSDGAADDFPQSNVDAKSVTSARSQSDVSLSLHDRLRRAQEYLNQELKLQTNVMPSFEVIFVSYFRGVRQDMCLRPGL